MSSNDAKWTVLPSFLASAITSFWILTFVSCHASIFSNFSHSFSTAAFAAGIFIAFGMGTNLRTKVQWLEKLPRWRNWTKTGMDDLPTDRLHPSCHPSYFGFKFSRIPPLISHWLVRHYAQILKLKMSSKQLFPEDCSASLLNESCDGDIVRPKNISELINSPGPTNRIRIM